MAWRRRRGGRPQLGPAAVSVGETNFGPITTQHIGVQHVHAPLASTGTEPAVSAWNVPPRLAHFTGRADLLARLDEALTETGTAAVCALGGLGGVGKTALALEHAHRHADDHDVIWWIPAEDPDLIDGHVCALGAALGLPDDATWPAIHRTLHHRKLRWLLILDNVEDPEAIGPYRPTDRYGRLLATSRRAGLDGFATSIDVPVFPHDDATAFLVQRVNTLDRATARTIGELLGDLPLALEQAAGYLAQTGLPPGDYARLLDERLGDMLHRGRVADRPGTTIANLWELSVARLRDDQPAAVDLLELCALCGAEPLPLDLIGDHPDRLSDGPLRNAASDSLRWADAVGALVGYGLAHRAGPTIVVHRLVSAAVRSNIPPSRRKVITTELLFLLRADLPADIDGHPTNWPRWRSLLPHLRTVLAGHADNEGDRRAVRAVSWLCRHAGEFLDHHGRPDSAIPYLQRALALNESGLGPGHPDTLATRNGLALAYRSAGDLGQAIAVLQQTLSDAARILGTDHAHTLAIRNSLASALESAGQFDRAIVLFEQNLTDTVRILGPDHHYALSGGNNLALAYQRAGRVDEAIVLLEQILSDEVRILGADHPHTLRSRSNLALAHDAAGRLDQAITLHEQNRTDRLRVLGPDHPDTVNTLHCLASAHHAAGHLDTAVTQFEQALADRVRILGPDHPATAITRDSLAAARAALDRGQAARPDSGGTQAQRA